MKVKELRAQWTTPRATLDHRARICKEPPNEKVYGLLQA